MGFIGAYEDLEEFSSHVFPFFPIHSKQKKKETKKNVTSLLILSLLSQLRLNSQYFLKLTQVWR